MLCKQKSNYFGCIIKHTGLVGRAVLFALSVVAVMGSVCCVFREALRVRIGEAREWFLFGVFYFLIAYRLSFQPILFVFRG